MARLDLTLGLIEAGLNGDKERVRTYATSAMAEERVKEHHHAADRIVALLDAGRRGGASGESKRGTIQPHQPPRYSHSRHPPSTPKTPPQPSATSYFPLNNEPKSKNSSLNNKTPPACRSMGSTPGVVSC